MIAMDIAPRDGLIVIPTVVIGLWLVLVACGCAWLQQKIKKRREEKRCFFCLKGEERKERTERQLSAKEKKVNDIDHSIFVAWYIW
jgi:hypothetical protein